MNSVPAGRPPFRADHIGSLLRPKKLREAFRRHAAGEIDDVGLRAAQDEAVRDAVRLQEDCGLQVVTDGEFRRVSYWEKFVRLTAGLVVKEAVFTFHDAHGHESTFTAPYAEGKVSRRAPITADEIGFVSQLTKASTKATMPSPSTMHFYRFTDWGDPKAYADPAAFFVDLGRIYQQEIAELSAAGCKLRAARRGGARDPLRPGGTRQGQGRRRRPRPAGRPVRRGDQRGGEEPPGRRDRRRARVPRQLQGHVPVRRRLRLGRRALLRAHRRQPLPARVRQPARRWLRPAALRAEEQGRGARTGQLEDPAARVDRHR